MTDTKITRQQALDALSCLPYSDRGNSALSVAQGYLTQLEQEGALLRARVEELEGTLDYERTGHAHIAKLVGVSEWDPQAVCDAIIRERAKVEAALAEAKTYLRTTSLALSQAGQRAIERERDALKTEVARLRKVFRARIGDPDSKCTRCYSSCYISEDGLDWPCPDCLSGAP